MKRLITVILCLCIPVFHLLAVEKINFHKGKAVNIDGCFNQHEWDDADSVELKLIDNNIVSIFFKHDGVNLLVAFCKNLKVSAYQFRFPEILLDINNTKTSNWDEDDHWFHVSATDCNSKGHPKDYSNCIAVQPDWLGEKNFLDPKFNDTVEISIPFTKVGLNPQQNIVFGIAFDVTDTQWLWEFYPQNATMNNPSTWAEATIIEDVNSIYNHRESLFSLFPNPANDRITISFFNSGLSNPGISIINSLGIEVKHIDEEDLSGQNSISFSTEEFPSGVYYIVQNFQGLADLERPKITIKSFIVVR
jgi:hypothetical protein